MPVGIQRLNAPRPQPNSRIVFIKPLPGLTSEYALDFLERIAAIVHPIMKDHSLFLTTLEEYEPNPEFIGRNFNAGEVIQLVLRSRGGKWLPFRTVQMVMMHELAHCIQMNHSKEFWKVKNLYAGQLKELWGRGYTGDGLWGRGQTLLSGKYISPQQVADPNDFPDTLCGGTYRSRRKRRKNPKLTWAEQKQRRIEKKFGKNGVSLGGDNDTRVKLEDEKKPKGKPRVAGSARGRELRAAAALARFGQQPEKQTKLEQYEYIKKEESEANEESGSGRDDEEIDIDAEAADINGQRLLDSQGHGMIKICEGEDASDPEIKRELEELQSLQDIHFYHSRKPHKDQISDCSLLPSKKGGLSETNSFSLRGIPAHKSTLPSSQKSSQNQMKVKLGHQQYSTISCPVCSMINSANQAACIACSHVLQTDLIPNHWSCRSLTCRDSGYLNPGDFGRCGICGTRKLT
ncbi:MAG: hypothetical protein M1834_003733 [Cirrosporium novae-zelandiae]|nr:MAG: hypothetical protein M1834_003733 [Cirrosporium novae-zelandiae]